MLEAGVPFPSLGARHRHLRYGVARGERERGKTALRQISLNKHVALDLLLDELRAGKILIRKTADLPDIKAKLAASKRPKTVTEQLSVWNKPTYGGDRLHYALFYTWLAAQICVASTCCRW